MNVTLFESTTAALARLADALVLLHSEREELVGLARPELSGMIHAPTISVFVIGFAVRVPLENRFVEYLRAYRARPSESYILLLSGIANTIA